MTRFTGPLIVLSLCLAAVGLQAEEKAAADAETHSRMAVVTNSLRLVLPESGTDARFGDRASRAKVGAALNVLADQSGRLSQHFNAAKPSLRFEARALAADAQATASMYDRGLYASARLTLHQLTDRCVSCHARLPSADSTLAELIVDQRALGKLPDLERARLQSATRQFGSAMDSFERHFIDPKRDPNQMSNAWRDYLTLAVRVKQKPARALTTVEAFAKRPHQNAMTSGEVTAWREALTTLAKRSVRRNGLAPAKAWLKKADALATAPTDRRPLVHWLAASGSLHRLIDAKTAKDAGVKGHALAEAYLLTVKTDFRIRQAYPVALAEDYLESAIRAAPKSKTAKEAYSTLEKVMNTAHQNSDGKVPAAVRSRLEELKDLAGA